ncbi:MAG: 50S ribosomal protein L30 [Methanobacteriota archaeon]|nr:MAG: 50S ribosomal protein L30 [Euryarchaeota archaeon]
MILMENGDLIAIVRVRGIRNIKPRIRRTLELLKLHKPNHAVIHKLNPSLRGMLIKAKDYITFGRIEESTFKALLAKRGHMGSKRLTKEQAEEAFKQFVEKGERLYEPVFRLHPPRKGWKNIKRPFTVGGDLGKRSNMDELLKRMM